MPSQPHADMQLIERAGYFQVPGAHLYSVLHEVEQPAARVLLVGPFASERHNTYIPWVRWARFLAERNIEVLRYDYRGIGESTGALEEMTFEDLSQDIRLLAEWLATRTPKAPLLLHGHAMGAVLAGRAFDEGIGDGLLLWSPPVSAWSRSSSSAPTADLLQTTFVSLSRERPSKWTDTSGQPSCGRSHSASRCPRH